jgi:hypothetical protein
MSQTQTNELFAFVTTNRNSEEEIMSAKINDARMPLVSADLEQVKSMLNLADKIKSETGQDFRILRFSTRHDITDDLL